MTNEERLEDFKKEYIGKVFKTNSFSDCIVIDYIDSGNVVVKFTESGYKTTVSSGNLRKGLVKDCLSKNVLGVGFLGVGEYACRVRGRSGGKDGYRAGCKTPEYSYWESLIRRVYGNDCSRTYVDVTVCDEWHNFQNFAKWCNKQKEFKAGMHLDKDLLVKGSRIYSPETCCFIPAHLNAAITGMKHTNTSGYTGVYLGEGVYHSEITMNSVSVSLGSYSNPEHASLIYKNIKKAYINSLAEIYKEVISEKAYEAALNWSV